MLEAIALSWVPILAVLSLLLKILLGPICTHLSTLYLLLPVNFACGTCEVYLFERLTALASIVLVLEPKPYDGLLMLWHLFWVSTCV